MASDDQLHRMIATAEGRAANPRAVRSSGEVAEMCRELLAARRVVDASGALATCPDHAGNCCTDWCTRCRDSEHAWRRLNDALDHYDQQTRGGRGGK